MSGIPITRSSGRTRVQWGDQTGPSIQIQVDQLLRNATSIMIIKSDISARASRAMLQYRLNR